VQNPSEPAAVVSFCDYSREKVGVGEVGVLLNPSLMTHHHHSLSLGNLCQFSGGHTLGTCRPLGGKSR